jgi:phage tail protein X
MMKKIANDGDRLDTIVFRHYETLEPFSIVLLANPHLHKKTVLQSGDVVYLPDWQPPKQKEAKSLW